MKKHYRTGRSRKKEDSSHLGFLEALIVRYFHQKQESKADEAGEEARFESDKVYNNVLNAIQARQSNGVRFKRNLWIAATVVLLAGLAGGYYYNTRNVPMPAPVVMVEKKAARGQTIAIVLPDGSKAWLNADSKLSYPENFTSGERKVTLTGEAYFEVVHLDQKPFIIHSGEMRTVVLGTKFNIRAYPENPVAEVAVISGKVSVTAPVPGDVKEQTLYITLNQKAAYQKQEKQLTTYTGIHAEESIAWREGKMKFRGAAIKQVIEEVERKYNVAISSSARLSHCTITVDFNNEELRKVLAVLARLVNGTVVYRQGTYYLEGNGCE